MKRKIKIKKKNNEKNEILNKESEKTIINNEIQSTIIKDPQTSKKLINISNDQLIDNENKKIYPLKPTDYAKKISEDLNISEKQVKNVIKLLDEDNTIPFIARYRKELTGSLDEVKLREIQRQLHYLRTLDNRKKEVLSSILTQGKLTKDLEEKILKSNKLSEVEELYLPYKPKRKTRATKAKEKGLEPLAKIIKKENNPEKFATQYINPEKGVKTEEQALKFAMDIIAEEFAENFEIRKHAREYIFTYGEFVIKKKNPDEIDEFDMYKDYKEPVKTIKNHRILAINRGEKKGKLSVKIKINDQDLIEQLYKNYIKENNYIENKYLKMAVEDGYKRLLFPAMENDIRKELTEKAEKEAIEVFATNLYNLLMTPPLKGRKILAIDPGIRTGSKIAILDETGKFITHDLIYQQNKIETINKIAFLVNKYKIDLIAIGNGTASREVEAIVAKTIKEKDLNCKYLIVAETGASVYSASDIAREEFPDLDVTVRGAISIGRRVLDPLSEFVKIDPKSLGVGQYQHDVNQKTLSSKLDEVVETCVNKVGVILNTASHKLLQYVSGISSSVAKRIVKYREEKGPFKSRFELLNVSGVGKKTFEQAAGFLRIPESENILDNSWIHPESYDIANEIIELQKNGVKITEDLKKKLADKYDKGIETINDIIEDLKKPGRDPRDEIDPPILKDNILSIDDLSEGLILKGTVRNVTKFGAFVDIGLKNAGLVHISEISDEFVEDPLSKVYVGQIVSVKVIGIDKERGRVSLSMKINKSDKNNLKNLSNKKNDLLHNSYAKNKMNQQNTNPKSYINNDGTITLGHFFKNLKKHNKNK